MKHILIALLLIATPAWSAVTQSAGSGSVTQSAGSGSVTQSAGGGTCSGSYGNTGTSDSSTVMGAGELQVVKIPLGCSDSPSSFTYDGSYVDRDDRRIYVVVYEDNAGEPGSLIGYDGPFYDGSYQGGPTSITFNISGISIPGDPANVWVGLQFEGAISRMYRISSGSQESRRLDGTFGAIPDQWDTGSDSSNASYNYIFTLDF